MLTVINVNNLTKKFNNLTAVSKLSFTVNKGDIFGFLGQNGAGKSTTIRMLLTLIVPTEGNIELLGMNLQTHRSEILKQVGAVVEKPDVYPYLSAYENIALFAKLSGIRPSREQIMNQLEVVGLASRAKDTVKTFSQGMKQRLGIGIALVHNPHLIILDEPTNGLDPQGIADIRNLILSLSKEFGKTVVVSSHLLSEIEQIASRILIIDKGKKLVEGNSNDLFDPAQTVVEISTHDFTYSLNILQQSKWKEFLLESRGNNILLKVHKENISLLLKELIQLNIPIISFQPRHSLEDYFLQITSNNQHVPAFTN
jgi:ABC-type multidrug transport system ATPase subunit